MKMNEKGREIIRLFKDAYEPLEKVTDARNAVKVLVKRTLTSNQFSALVCFVMRIGVDEFKRCELLRYLNTRDINSAIAASQFFCEYNYDSFLAQQAELERALFLTPEIVGGKR